MEILDEYSLHCGEGKHIKAFSQIVKLLGGRWDPGSNSWKPHNLFESVAPVQEQEPYDVGQRENRVPRCLFFSFPRVKPAYGSNSLSIKFQEP